MKNQHYAFLLCLIIILFSSCKPDEPQIVVPTVSTATALDIKGNGATLGGTVTAAGSGEIIERGVCWSLNANPTFDGDFSKSADGSGLGSFSIEISDLDPQTTYHVRAYARTSDSFEAGYGSDITFTTGDIFSFTTHIARDIMAKRAELAADIDAPASIGGFIRGFALSQSPNPTISDINESNQTGPNDVDVSLTNLEVNTTYYARPYASFNNEYFYGDEITFKTGGYFGPGGGYVVFDKGEVVDGWRYLEAAPNQIADNFWGCDNQFMSNTFPEVGRGLDNTNQIVGKCTEGNCAARLCDDYTGNGLNDWFSPSTEEAFLAMISLRDINIGLSPNSMWTSTESSSSKGIRTYWDNGSLFWQTNDKDKKHEILPMRRY